MSVIVTRDEYLEPCPFCLGEAELREWDWPYVRYQVRCSKCKSHARARMAIKAEAITAWNTRASEDAERPYRDLVTLVKIAQHWHAFNCPPDGVPYDDLDDLWLDINEFLQEVE